MNIADLHLDDRIIYHKALACPGQRGVSPQDAMDGPYKGVIVWIGQHSVQVREHGITGEPLYEVMLSDIISRFPARP